MTKPAWFRRRPDVLSVAEDAHSEFPEPRRGGLLVGKCYINVDGWNGPTTYVDDFDPPSIYDLKCAEGWDCRGFENQTGCLACHLHRNLVAA